MRGMAGFDPAHAGTYHIARSAVTPPGDLLASFWPPLNSWIETSFRDFATTQFVRLLAYL